MLDDGIRGSKKVSAPRVAQMVIQPPSSRGNCLFTKARDIPDTNGLVKRGGGYQVFTRVKLSTHYIVVVASQDTGRGGGREGGGEDCDTRKEGEESIILGHYKLHSCFPSWLSIQ